MDSFMTIEWDDKCGIEGDNVIDFVNEVSDSLRMKSYGDSISKL
jgi:hypothetical protein